MVNTKDTIENALAVKDIPGVSSGGNHTLNAEYITRLEHKNEVPRGELQQVQDLANLVVTTLPNPPRFPSLDTPIPK